MRSCCLCNKKVTPDSGSFFKIPTDERRRSKWSEICRMQFSNKSHICSDHFLPSDIISRATSDSLMPSAVPFVPRSIGDTKSVSYADAPSTNFNNICPQDFLDITMEDSVGLSNNALEHMSYKMQTDPISLERKIPKENQDYKKIIKNLQAANKNLQADNKDLKRKLAETKAAVNFTSSIFTEGQVRKMVNPGQVQWNRDDISSAIRLHASGPKTYKYLYKKGFPLPHASALEHWCRKVNINKGFLSSSLGFIKHCTELTSKDKICVIAFEEMKVMATNDDDSVDNNIKPTNCVQVVMARGLLKSWKRPIFFDFDCQMTKDILCSLITKVNQAGFPVVAMVCNSEPVNLKLWNDLGVTKERPWFPNPMNPEEKVFTFANAPHLLDLIRCHYLDTGLMWNNELLTTRTIADLLIHTSNGDKSISFQLTKEHLSVKGEGGQKLAEQLFSNTTANAIRSCVSTGASLTKSNETADLIQLVNDWFGVLNSSINTFSSPGKEPFGIALADQQRILLRMNKLMSSPIIPHKTALECFQDAVIISNTALEMLYDYVKQKFNITYILTNRLNQNVLKHVFGVIRSNRGLGDHPTPKEFIYGLRKYMLAQNVEHLRGIANIESDATDWLSSTDTQTIRKYADKRKVAAKFDGDGED